MAEQRFFCEYTGRGMGHFYEASEILLQKQSQFQKMILFESPSLGRCLRLDNYLQTSEMDEFLYHEPLSHLPLLSHPDPESVLIIGGGDGGLAHQVLKHNSVKQCTLVDIDEEVVQVSREQLECVHHGSFDDPRLSVKCIDGLAYMRENAESGVNFDVILLDLTDPDACAADLYTDEFYSLCKSNLKPDGFLALHTEYPFFYREMHGRIIATLKSLFKNVRPFYNYVVTYGSIMGFAACSDRYDPADLSRDEIKDRINERGISGLNFLTPDTYQACIAQPPWVQEIYKKKHRIVTKEDPITEISELNRRHPFVQFSEEG